MRSLTYQEFLRQAVDFQPQLICITMLTADFAEAALCAQLLRRALPHARIVAGGPHPSGEAQGTLLQIPELDGVGIGPGEGICLDLANGSEVSETPGCVYLDHGHAIEVGKRCVDKNIDNLPFPAWDLIDGDFYAEPNIATTFNFLTRSMGVMTSRGCPGSCYFCSSKWNRPVRVHSPEYVLDLCTYLVKRYAIDTIAFWDDTMSIYPERLAAICEGFMQRGLHKRLKWRAHLRANQTTPELVQLMKQAGCFYAAFGIESGNDRILNLLNKQTTVAQNRAAAMIVKQAGLLFGGSIILGTPSETEAEMLETIRFCVELDPDSLGIGRFCPLPGSPSYQALVKDGVVDPRTANWEMLGNFSSSDGPCYADIDPQRFKQVLAAAQNHFYRRNNEKFVYYHQNSFPELVQAVSQK